MIVADPIKSAKIVAKKVVAGQDADIECKVQGGRLVSTLCCKGRKREAASRFYVQSWALARPCTQSPPGFYGTQVRAGFLKRI